MQHIKGTEKIGVLKEVAHTDVILSDSLAKVVDKFELEKHLASFNLLKNRGFTIGSLLKVSIIMPFAGAANVYALLKHGITDMVIARKDAYYTAKNNEHIDWRRLLYMTAKRFKHLVNKDTMPGEKRVTAIIFDDTLLEKSGKGIEKISLTFDHVTKRFVLGYKLLLCGFWDGVSFLPLDFTLHREKGSRQHEITSQYHRATKTLGTTKALLKKSQQQLDLCHKKLLASELRIASKPNLLKNSLHKQTQLMYQKVESEVQAIENQLIIDTKAQIVAKQKLKQMYSHGPLFGLTKTERKAQFKKSISAKCCGYTRRKEADRSKGEQLIVMLKRAVKNNFIPQYVLTDSWFFCESLIVGVKSIRNGCINLISMVKINNQVFKVDKGQKEIGVKLLLKSCLTSKASNCKKIHASYYKRSCDYKGTAVNLFFVKMGRSSNWHLLATTDLKLNFVELMETYQIRWSIEVFFHETKSYLNLGKCQASNFDAQIADTTITMIQYAMLSYCKRINYQTSFGDLFKELSAERMRHNLLSKLLDIFWILVRECSFSAGFDMIVIQRDIMQNPEMASRIEKLMTGKVFNNAA
jgi:hypothetical protein